MNRVPVLRYSMIGRTWIACLIVAVLTSGGVSLQAQSRQEVPLTLEGAVDMAMQGSYRVRQLQLGIERTRMYLKAERAALRSRVSLNLTTPEFEAVSDHKWNSSLRRNEIIRENTRLWQTNVSVRQPVILFGYPTNGYLSLNNRMYRYTQLNEGREVDFYNRYFVKFEQPFFQPNELKNDLEDARLNLEEAELEYQEDIADLLDDLADDYYDLFALAYTRKISDDHVGDLERALAIAVELAAEDTSRALEAEQIRVELANARERTQQAASNYRLEAARLKQRLDLDPDDSLAVDPVLDVRPVFVPLGRAVTYGETLRPRLRRLEIRRQKDRIDLSNTRGWNSFRANLEVTYGRETLDPRFLDLWEEPTNSWSVGLHAYVPIWDWGRRKARVQAEQISLQKTELYIEETEKDIRSDITLAVQNLDEFQQRALTMQENLERARSIARLSLSRYAQGMIGVLDLLQSFYRERETADNFLDTYMGYRRALLQLQLFTYYDFETDMPLLQRFGFEDVPTP